MAPARRFEIAVTTFQRRYFGSGQHLDIRLRLDALDKVIGHSRLQTSATGQQPYLLYVTRSHVDLEFAAAQLVLEMLAQRLLVDLELLGAVSLSEAESRSVLDERALVCGRHIFGWYFPFRVAQLRDARARGGKLRSSMHPGTSLSCAIHIANEASRGFAAGRRAGAPAPRPGKGLSKEPASAGRRGNCHCVSPNHRSVRDY